MATGRDDLNSGLKVSELREKLAEFGLSTQGNKEIPKERLASFLDAEGSKDDDFLIENPPNETEMTIETPQIILMPFVKDSKAQSLKDKHITEYMPCMMKFQKYLTKDRPWGATAVQAMISGIKVKKRKSGRVKVMLLTRDDSQRRFLVQNSITTFLIMRHCATRILLNVLEILFIC